MPSIEYNLNLDDKLPEDIKKVAIENGECELTKTQMIAEFRNYIQEHDRCQPHRTDDEYLIKFLRARYWKIEPSYKLLCHYYKFREQNKSYYEKVRPVELKFINEANILTVTPYRDQKGHRIIIYRFGKWKTNEVNIDDIFRASVCLLEMGSMEPIGQVVGGVGIFDLKDFTLGHVLHLSPSVAQKMIAMLVTSMPIRTSALHIVNQNWVFNTAFNIFKPFLDSSMKENLFIHGSDMSSLHKHISPEYLPKRYGGIHEDYPGDMWFETLSKNKTLLKELEQLGYVFDEIN
ncbi:alpha-tocopherol transfer protein [Lucilia sericata]|uniref:alpha-tocopherol transfer protein n=1 Tax=Lucilia sericata TaxID=13632 RepID=UPI0018A7FAED|nr:alpha-tocopherol transfer protein [Lucilia sericata]XP_037821208.1 alpha-tocopherol transfer protein [Lucilia sericata]